MSDKELLAFVKYVMDSIRIDTSRVSIIDYDLKRVYLLVDNNKEYTVRVWESFPGYLRYSLFERVGNSGKAIVEGAIYPRSVNNR